jgi:uncharacterized protein YndB with AHSA1/START domain
VKRGLRLERLLPYAPEEVWAALTDPEALAEWLMPNDFEPRVGHRFRFTSQQRMPTWGGVVECEVLEVTPGRLVRFSWLDSWRWAKMEHPTEVTFKLEPVAGGTRLVLEHTGFEGLGPVLLARMLSKGWGQMLEKLLPAAIERRRTAMTVTQGKGED